MTTWFPVVLEISIIASAVVSGVFLTFSDFVMRSLDRADRAAGIEVMQVINREVFHWVFMALLLGMSALSPLLAVYAYYNLAETGALFVEAGGIIYFIGVFVVSLIYNIPMNNRLDRLSHTSAEAAEYWSTTYFPKWTYWNYVRAISACVAAICFLIASLIG